jgi:hypothetical protein
LTNKKNGFKDVSEIMVTEGMVYTIPDEDQYDFNKLCGWKGNYFRPRFNTAMVGWRWNPIKNCFEFVPYFHLGSSAYVFDVERMVNAKVGDILRITYEVIYKSVSVKIENLTTNTQVVELKVFTKEHSRFWKINPWFGGQKTAPKDFIFQFD